MKAEEKLDKRAEILREAEKRVCGHRQEDYGTPEDSFKAIAELWTAYYKARYRIQNGFTSLDVAMMMALLKVARIAGGKGTMDSVLDLAGYAACAGEVKDKSN